MRPQDPSLPDPQAEAGEVTKAGTTSNFPTCFADYLNAIHRHRQPLVTAADVLEHTMDPIEYRTIKMVSNLHFSKDLLVSF